MQNETDTVLILRSLRDSVCVIRNEVAEEVLWLEADGASIGDILPLVKGIRGKELMDSGDTNAGIQAYGQGIGLIDDLPGTREIVERVAQEAVE